MFQGQMVLLGPGMYKKYWRSGMCWDVPRYPKEKWYCSDLGCTTSTGIVGNPGMSQDVPRTNGTAQTWDVREVLV